MDIVIDLESSEPVFAQLIDQVKHGIQLGLMSPGDALPSIRQLSNDLDLNNKTVAKAYKLLERDGVIETKGYRGTFIHPSAKKNCDVDLSSWVTARLTDSISELKKAGVTDSEIRVAFNKVMKSD